MSNSYDRYRATHSGSGSSQTITRGTERATADAITITGGTNYGAGILGAGSTFTLAGNGNTYTYVGYIQWTSGGVTHDAIVATRNGNYYIISPAGVTPPTTSTLIPVVSGTTSTYYNISTNLPGCFLSGTMIATPDGERAIETLKAGDLVLTADGVAKPVRWLGHTVVSGVFGDRSRVVPVRIKAGALGANVPARDLLVSAGHALLVEGVLVNAAALVNGTSIVREDGIAANFTYYHLELDTHAVILAEGAPAESFLDSVEEIGFANWADRVAPADARELDYPRAKSARQVPQAVRERLAERVAELTGGVAAAA
jgi:hypothetical protein